MVTGVTDIPGVADGLMRAFHTASTLPPMTAHDPDFDLDAAYQVLAEIERRRIEAGWVPKGRKIGFTNTTIWELYGVDKPMWARVWDRTVHMIPDGRASLELAPFVQPRLEPEIAFKLRTPLPVSTDARVMLEAVEWMAPSYEVVQCHFPDWKFKIADCSASCGLHGALFVGEQRALTDADRDALVTQLPAVEVTLARNGEIVDRGTGANVLGSPALALAYLAQVIDAQPDAPPLTAGEILTTGTITNAAAVVPGETYTSDYGELGLGGLTISFT
jgi:2-oxo-3-hexenedioate decarboxylase